ncbi:NAD(P)/FAD-dependent oxidoreductase [Lewinella sp. IMCC34183]|uniref:NAD(P)/FAD-dependent oxidoreductase n=1 Tax=Lewinella sp. IMCC34183 TaxID=2248762 RepID=UPI001E29299A|nr:FAD-dependent oxidoreductase [Lewinella sp. IMCC34183]
MYLAAKTIDYLIVGQGLAGTLIGYRLERAGHHVDYVDAPEQRAASSVAAGIINPITGRRFVKSWRIDELLPAARSLYGELEALLGVQLWYELPLIRTLFNRGDENDWLARGGDPAYAGYLIDDPALGRIPELTQPAYAYAGVGHSARVDVAALVSAFRVRQRDAGRFHAVALAYPDVVPEGASVRVTLGGDPRRYDRVVFCEGWLARHNPWFGYLPHGGTKGEVLIVRTAAPALDRLFKHRIFLVPQGRNTYWVGATNANRFDDDSPTPTNRQYLEDRLREVLTVPYEILEHQSAVRPTVRDRRPLLGRHPKHPALSIFNGLGTKGASLAPLTSRWLVDHLEDGTALPPEVDLARF